VRWITGERVITFKVELTRSEMKLISLALGNYYHTPMKPPMIVLLKRHFDEALEVDGEL
jgi:hypothetical protein